MRAHDPGRTSAADTRGAADRAAPVRPAVDGSADTSSAARLLALQRTAGNAAVNRALGRGGHGAPGATAVQRARTSQTAPARVDGNRLLDLIVGKNRTLAGFGFGPECRNNGGNNLISRPVEVEVRDGDTTARLAVHLNVMLTTGGEVHDRTSGSSSVKIHGGLFHLTARRAASQNLIHQAGASALTADESIHVGRSNAGAGWNSRSDNTRILAGQAGVSQDALVAALTSRFPPGEVAELVETFKRDVGRVVINSLLPEVVTVTWEGDASFA
ncbi:hypothetical protein [Streptacidiphilus neutrinimicus]|uniref:hypothetical protein n=1 Tax=Streptacidiphilus neutrinimicus TaxID=105420 RepID=UPI0005AB427E|nr:hypothetical protein [Streptacidiphilus neutrinimicus]